MRKFSATKLSLPSWFLESLIGMRDMIRMRNESDGIGLTVINSVSSPILFSLWELLAQERNLIILGEIVVVIIFVLLSKCLEFCNIISACRFYPSF